MPNQDAIQHLLNLLNDNIAKIDEIRSFLIELIDIIQDVSPDAETTYIPTGDPKDVN